MFSIGHSQIEYGDYDFNLRVGKTSINYHKKFESLEIGAMAFKNRKNDSPNLFFHSVSILSGKFSRTKKPLRIGFKIGSEYINGYFPLLGIKTEIYYLRDELYIQPQVGLSVLFALNFYIGYSYKINKNKTFNESAGYCLSFYINFIDFW